MPLGGIPLGGIPLISNKNMNIGYYHLELMAFLKEHFPHYFLDLSNDELKEFIHSRATKAETIYAEGLQQGLSPTQCEENAHAALMAELDFSVFDFIKEVLESDFPQIYQQILQRGADELLYEALKIHHAIKNHLTPNVQTELYQHQIFQLIQNYYSLS
jgi:hypothetical protein